MSADIISLKPTYRRSREAELWDAYLLALARVQAEYPMISVDSCRRLTSAYDAFEAERQKCVGHH